MRVTVLGPTTELLSDRELPFLEARVPAGFPSPAADYIQKSIALGDLLVTNPLATFLIRIEGHSMKDAGIIDGDIAVVDRSISPTHGKVVVAVIDGEFTIKRLIYRDGRCFLAAANPAFADIEVSDCSENSVWGVVTNVVHKL